MANKNIKINLDYSSFSGGIKECNSKMQILTEQFKLQKTALGSNAEEIDKLTLLESTLTQKIQLQEQIVEQSVAKFAALATSEGATQKQIDAAQKSMIKQQTALQELKNEAQSTSEKIKELNKAENDGSEASINAAEKAREFAESINKITVVAGVASAIKNIASAMSDVAREASSSADDILTLSTQYGISTQQMQEFVAVEGLVDVSAETLGASMGKLARQMNSAKDGTGTAAEAFKRLGVNVTDSGGHLLNAEQTFYSVIDALGQVENETERDALAMTVFGRSAQELNPIIEKGSEEFLQLANSMSGLTLSEGMLNELGELQNSFDVLDQAVSNATKTMIAAFAPQIRTVIDSISQMDPALLGLIVILGKMGSAVLPLFSSMSQLASSMTMSSAATQMAAAAEMGKVAADEATTASTIGLNLALAPELAILIAIVAAAALVAAAAYAIASAFDEEKRAAEETNEELEGTWKWLDKIQSVSGATSGSMGGQLLSATSHMATGSTQGGAGGWTWVGEQGAELVNLPHGSTVYNHEESRSMSSSSNTNNYYVTIDAKNVNDFNKVVKVFSGLGQSMNRGGLVNG